jgi:nitrate reductase NapE component
MIGAALVRRQDLFIAAQSSYAESEALTSFGAVSLGIYPILAEGILGGCLYFDRLTARPAPSERTLDLVGRLRDLTAKAITLRRPVAA